nr:hypothetical protein [Streptomyces bathyalis]
MERQFVVGVDERFGVSSVDGAGEVVRTDIGIELLQRPMGRVGSSGADQLRDKPWAPAFLPVQQDLLPGFLIQQHPSHHIRRGLLGGEHAREGVVELKDFPCSVGEEGHRLQLVYGLPPDVRDGQLGGTQRPWWAVTDCAHPRLAPLILIQLQDFRDALKEFRSRSRSSTAFQLVVRLDAAPKRTGYLTLRQSHCFLTAGVTGSVQPEFGRVDAFPRRGEQAPQTATASIGQAGHRPAPLPDVDSISHECRPGF